MDYKAVLRKGVFTILLEETNRKKTYPNIKIVFNRPSGLAEKTSTAIAVLCDRDGKIVDVLVKEPELKTSKPWHVAAILKGYMKNGRVTQFNTKEIRTIRDVLKGEKIYADKTILDWAMTRNIDFLTKVLSDFGFNINIPEIKIATEADIAKQKAAAKSKKPTTKKSSTGRGPGRPKGSKNLPKEPTGVPAKPPPEKPEKKTRAAKKPASILDLA